MEAKKLSISIELLFVEHAMEQNQDLELDQQNVQLAQEVEKYFIDKDL